MIEQHILLARIQALQDSQLFVNDNMKHELHVYVETLQKCFDLVPDERQSYYESLLFMKEKFGFSQGYEIDMEIRIDAYEYVIEVEHNKDDELMDADFFKKFDNTLQAIVEQSDGQYTVNKQAYENFKNQVLNNEKYRTVITDYSIDEVRELMEDTLVCLTQGLDDTIDAPVIVPCKPPPCPEFGTGDLSDVPTYPKEEKEAFDYSDECVDPACCEEDYPNECEPEVPDCCDECVPEGPEDMPFPEEDDNPLGAARCMECGALFDTTPKDLLEHQRKDARRCWKCKKIISIVQLKAQVKD